MQTIRMSGWLESRIADLVTGTAATFHSETWGNIEHYYKKFGAAAPKATILYVVKEDVFEGKKTQYFLKATNMPHTYDIYNRILTPYCNKVDEEGPAKLSKRGYGGILPFLYTGGVTNIQWENPDGTYSQIVTDIDAQKAAAMAKADDTALPKPNYTANIVSLGRKAERFYSDVEFWGQEVIDAFVELGIKTWEVTINPTFNGRENIVGDCRQFQHFLEGLQTQFEEAIMSEKLNVTGIFLGEEPATYLCPFRFQDENSEAFFDVNGVVSTSGLYNLKDEFTIECMYINTAEPSAAPSQYVRYTKRNGEQLYFVWKYSGGTSYTSELLTDPIEFVPDFTHTYGRSPLATLYAGTIKSLPKDELHPLQYDSIENYAAGAYVSANGMRATSKPIEIPGFPKVANLMDHSDTREFVNILSKRAAGYIHFQDWKECSKFKQTSKPHDNPIVFAILAMLLFQKKAFKSLNQRSEEAFIAALSSTRISAPAAAAEGKNFEALFGRLVEAEFTDMEHLIGDQQIKRDIMKLPLNSQGNQAIDTLHTTDGMWIATQVKSGLRDKDDAFHDFVHTFRLLRDKALETGDRCFGILVHYKGLKNVKAADIISREPGLSIVSREDGEQQETFEQRCLEHIRRIRKYY